MTYLLNYLKTHYKVTALILGLLSTLALPPLYVVPMMLMTLAGGFCLCDHAKNNIQAAAIGYWFGFGFFAAGFYWIGNALLVDMAVFGWLYPLTLIVLGAFFGLFAIVPFMLWRLWQNPWAKAGAFSASWVVLEWLRSFILTGFPWNMLGSIWTFDPIFIQTASLFGTYGLSFLTLWLAAALYMICQRPKIAGTVLLLSILAAMYGYGYWRVKIYNPALSDTIIRLVQPSIPQSIKWSAPMLEKNFHQYIEMSRADNWENVDIVVWGETAMPFDLESRDFYRKRIAQAIPPEGYLITGAVRFGGEEDDFRPYNSMFVIDKQAQILGFYDKQHLVPFGEYIPYRQYLPNWVRPVTNTIADFAAGKHFTQVELEGIPSFGALICYEIIFPDHVIDRHNKPSWVVLLTNDGWYGDSSGPYQHLAAAQLRAVEEGLTIVRSANSGVSAVINPVGQITERIDFNQKAIKDVKLPLNLKLSTGYNYYGNLPVVSSMILILCILFILKLLKMKQDAKKTVDFCA